MVLINFVKNIVRQLNIAPDMIRVGAVSFSTTGKREFTLSQYSSKEDVLSAIDKILYPQDRTNIADALRIARTQVFTEARPGAGKLALLITDGKPNEEEARTEPEATLLKNTGVVIEAIGITDLIDFNQLKRIATDPNNVKAVDDFTGLEAIIDSVAQSISCPTSEYKLWAWSVELKLLLLRVWSPNGR